MGEYEPRDSRNVTQSTHRAPGEPKRTGPREKETRQPQAEAQQGELTEDERGEDAEATVAVEQQQEQAQPPAAGVGEAAHDNDDEGPERFDRND